MVVGWVAAACSGSVAPSVGAARECSSVWLCFTDRKCLNPQNYQLCYIWQVITSHRPGTLSSSADCLAALLASVIAGLRREEAGQATIFSKRDAHIFFKTASVAAQAEIFTVYVPVAVPISFYLITLPCPCPEVNRLRNCYVRRLLQAS